MADNGTDHLVHHSNGETNGYDNAGFLPPEKMEKSIIEEVVKDLPTTENGHISPAPTNCSLSVTIPNGHNGTTDIPYNNGVKSMPINGSAVVLVDCQDGRVNGHGSFADHDDVNINTDTSKELKCPLDTKLPHYVSENDAKMLNSDDLRISIPNDTVLNINTGRVRLSKNSNNVLPQCGDEQTTENEKIPLQDMTSTTPSEEECEKALEAAQDHHQNGRTPDDYVMGDGTLTNSDRLTSEKIQQSNGTGFDEYFIPVNTHKKCLRGEKLYLAKDSNKLCHSWRRVVICGLIFIVIAVAILVGVLAATGILIAESESKNTRHEGGTLPDRASISHAGHHSSSHPQSQVPHKYLPLTTVDVPVSTTRIPTTSQAIPEVTTIVPTQKTVSQSHTIVPNALVGEFTILNEPFTSDLSDNKSYGYLHLKTQIETELSKMIKLGGGGFKSIEVLSFRQGSIIVKFVLIWNEKRFIPAKLVRQLVKSYMMVNGNSFLAFQVGLDSLKFTDVVDECHIQNGGCSYDCHFNYDTLKRTCLCGNGMQLMMDGIACTKVSSDPVTTQGNQETPSTTTSQEFSIPETKIHSETTLDSTTSSPSLTTSTMAISPVISTDSIATLNISTDSNSENELHGHLATENAFTQLTNLPPISNSTAEYENSTSHSHDHSLHTFPTFLNEGSTVTGIINKATTLPISQSGKEETTVTFIKEETVIPNETSFLDHKDNYNSSVHFTSSSSESSTEVFNSSPTDQSIFNNTAFFESITTSTVPTSTTNVNRIVNENGNVQNTTFTQNGAKDETESNTMVSDVTPVSENTATSLSSQANDSFTVVLTTSENNLHPGAENNSVTVGHETSSAPVSTENNTFSIPFSETVNSNDSIISPTTKPITKLMRETLSEFATKPLTGLLSTIISRFITEPYSYTTELPAYKIEINTEIPDIADAESELITTFNDTTVSPSYTSDVGLHNILSNDTFSKNANNTDKHTEIFVNITEAIVNATGLSMTSEDVENSSVTLHTTVIPFTNIEETGNVTDGFESNGTWVITGTVLEDGNDINTTDTTIYNPFDNVTNLSTPLEYDTNTSSVAVSESSSLENVTVVENFENITGSNYNTGSGKNSTDFSFANDSAENFTTEFDSTITDEMVIFGNVSVYENATEYKSVTDVDITTVQPTDLSTTTNYSLLEFTTTEEYNSTENATEYETTVGIECREDQFLCEDLNVCLNNTFLCDGIEDCPVGFDEINCTESCRANFMCSNSSTCITNEAHCDGIWDCDDGSDERNCTPTECAKHEVMCTDGSTCIKPGDICDWKYDCRDRSDEVGCVERTTCESGGRFFCNDGLCIPWSLKCDGNFDCKDKEDEGNCTCLADEFRCNDGKCLKSSTRCDGHNDCLHAEDEMGCVSVDEEGLVMTYEPYSGTFSLVCADDWTLDDGHYLCQELGFGHALQNEKFHVSFNGTWMAMKRDNLTASSLWTERVTFAESCDSNFAAAVTCQKFDCGNYSGLLHRRRRSLDGPYYRRKRQASDMSSVTNQWPFIGYISTFKSAKGCLCEILTPIWLITSAECLLSIGKNPFNGSDWYVRTNVAKGLNSDVAQNHEVLKIVPHHHSSKFRSLTLRDYDVALIRLKHALVFSEKIGAICLPEEEVPPGITCFSGVLGAQKPRAPPPTSPSISSLAVMVLERDFCNQEDHYNEQINGRMICTKSSDSSDSQHVCDNDEGTPLMCLSGPNKWYLAGTLTYQRYCGAYIWHPAVFSNLYSMRSFVDQVTGQKLYGVSYKRDMYVIVPPTTIPPTESTTIFMETTTESVSTTALIGMGVKTTLATPLSNIKPSPFTDSYEAYRSINVTEHDNDTSENGTTYAELLRDIDNVNITAEARNNDTDFLVNSTLFTADDNFTETTMSADLNQDENVQPLPELLNKTEFLALQQSPNLGVLMHGGEHPLELPISEHNFFKSATSSSDAANTTDNPIEAKLPVSGERLSYRHLTGNQSLGSENEHPLVTEVHNEQAPALTIASSNGSVDDTTSSVIAVSSQLTYIASISADVENVANHTQPIDIGNTNITHKNSVFNHSSGNTSLLAEGNHSKLATETLNPSSTTTGSVTLSVTNSSFTSLVNNDDSSLRKYMIQNKNKSLLIQNIGSNEGITTVLAEIPVTTSSATGENVSGVFTVEHQANGTEFLFLNNSEETTVPYEVLSNESLPGNNAFAKHFVATMSSMEYINLNDSSTFSSRDNLAKSLNNAKVDEIDEERSLKSATHTDETSCGHWSLSMNSNDSSWNVVVDDVPSLKLIQVISEQRTCMSSMISSNYGLSLFSCLNSSDPNDFTVTSGDGFQYHITEVAVNHLSVSKNDSRDDVLVLVKFKEGISNYSCLPDIPADLNSSCVIVSTSSNSSDTENRGQAAVLVTPVHAATGEHCNSTNTGHAFLPPDVCFQTLRKDINLCDIDLGAALLCLNDWNQWKLQGLLTSCTTSHYPVITSAHSARTWIMENMYKSSMSAKDSLGT